MRVGKVTSAVEGVGSSRRENTPTKGRLESLSIHVSRKCTLQTMFQVYAPLQTYVYENVPMSEDRSMGAVWFKRKSTCDSELKESQTPEARRNKEGTG